MSTKIEKKPIDPTQSILDKNTQVTPDLNIDANLNLSNENDLDSLYEDLGETGRGKTIDQTDTRDDCC